MRVLVLEDNDERIKWFREKLAAHHLDVGADVGWAAHMLRQHKYSAIFLDHDLDEVKHGGYNEAYLRGTGAELARLMAVNQWNKDAAVVVHSCNPDGAARIHYILEADGGYTDVYQMPFTTLRKIVGLARWLGLEE